MSAVLPRPTQLSDNGFIYKNAWHIFGGFSTNQQPQHPMALKYDISSETWGDSTFSNYEITQGHCSLMVTFFKSYFFYFI
jgi:hypothetical protein